MTVIVFSFASRAQNTQWTRLPGSRKLHSAARANVAVSVGASIEGAKGSRSTARVYSVTVGCAYVLLPSERRPWSTRSSGLGER
jgi:hypothetical protein